MQYGSTNQCRNAWNQNVYIDMMVIFLSSINRNGYILTQFIINDGYMPMMVIASMDIGLYMIEFAGWDSVEKNGPAAPFQST